MNQRAEHERWMGRCLTLAAEGAGAVSPNPMVGAVLVTNGGFVLGEGRHRRFGGPHAEVEALADALSRHSPDEVAESTLYVNLEPCCHEGKTPPCTMRILESGIRRVVVGMTDPFPAVAGEGIRQLENAGVAVIEHVLESECVRLNEAFVRHIRHRLPLVVLKQAMTLDGRVATEQGDARWITGPDARALVHRWRTELDAVLVGSTTVRMDDPQLTVRHVDGRQPLRVVLDRGGVLDSGMRVFRDEHAHRTLVFVGNGAQPAYRDILAERGGQIMTAPTRDGHFDLTQILRILAEKPVNEGKPVQSVLVEAGHALASAFFESDLVDRHYVFVAARLLGRGLPLLTYGQTTAMSEASAFAEHTWEHVGGDILLRGFVRPTFSYINPSH
jgi:diaminohydroxyphosphoribosylaminopyrimidine deaminase / 5-amino-6-(5-phosphoribosylamino)uracil reductase